MNKLKIRFMLFVVQTLMYMYDERDPATPYDFKKNYKKLVEDLNLELHKD